MLKERLRAAGARPAISLTLRLQYARLAHQIVCHVQTQQLVLGATKDFSHQTESAQRVTLHANSAQEALAIAHHAHTRSLSQGLLAFNAPPRAANANHQT